MSTIAARYFDGRQWTRYPVTLLATGGRLKVIGRDIDLDFDLRRVRRSLRVGDTPRWLYLPGGGACVTDHNDAIDRITRARRYERILHRWESRPLYAAFAVLLVIATAWLLLDRGLPAAVEVVATRIPIETEITLGKQSLAGLDQYFMSSSRLPYGRRAALSEGLSRLARQGGEQTPYRLEYRASKAIGANAFALPSGIIVVTDELVKLSQRDEEVLGVLAHELGHVHHRHTMRRLLEGSITALVVAGIAGDVSSAASLASAGPTLLLQTKYSRENEREADAFAIELMRKSGINPGYFASMLERLEKQRRRGPGIPSFLASHPATKDREMLANAASTGPIEPAKAQEVLGSVQRVVVALTPEQREIEALFRHRDFDGLERLLSAKQRAFERDEGAMRALESAFDVFERLPEGSLQALDQWVASHPESQAALVARGCFLLGRDAAKARADFQASIAKVAKPYLGRLGVLITLDPRLGGSLAAMEAYAAESQAVLKDSIAARAIAARIPAYRGDERLHAGDAEGALRLYTDSVALYADGEVLCRRAQALGALGRPAEAFADVKRSLALPYRSPYCQDRAVAAVLSADSPQDAIAVLDEVIASDPQHTQAYTQRAWALEFTGRADLAFQDMLAAAKIGDGWAQLQVGKAYASGAGVKRNRREAIAWLEKAAEQDVEDAERQLDLVRAQPN